MTTTPLTAPTTGLLDVGDARLHHELRGSGPLVVLVAAPMDADAFAPLADLLATDRTVLTTDPRGIRRSTVADPDADATVELRADDVAALVAHVGLGPAELVVGSSGGAVTLLDLATRHPDAARVVVAHEPPLHAVLPDDAELAERTRRMVDTHLSGDVVGAWQQFMEIADIPMPPELVAQMFGGDRTPQDVADDHMQFAHMLWPTVRYQPDVDALRASPTRVVVGIGEESTGQLCDRSSRALAALLGVEPVLFPSDHIGFVEDPPAFAARLREVLWSTPPTAA